MTDSVFESKDYKEAIDAVDSAARNLEATVNRLISERDGDDGERTMVFGWVLTIGQMGTDPEGEEFNGAIVEWPNEQNMFTSLGLADYAKRYLSNQVTIEED
jgi:hypothetical protein